MPLQMRQQTRRRPIFPTNQRAPVRFTRIECASLLDSSGRIPQACPAILLAYPTDLDGLISHTRFSAGLCLEFFERARIVIGVRGRRNRSRPVLAAAGRFLDRVGFALVE